MNNLNFEQIKYAYFSMEVGLSYKIPTYSGGLGVLAGDTLKTAADTGLPMVGVTLLTKKGYFFQEILDKKQIEKPMAWSIDDFLIRVSEKVEVKIQGEKVLVGAWKYEIVGVHGHVVPVVFLDVDFEENSSEMRALSDSLYGDGPHYRLGQEIILGVGGIRILQKMGFKNLSRYHMNEGHSALLALELERQLKDFDLVRKKCIFTTHTPVPAGHDKFKMDLVKKMLEPELFSLVTKDFHEKKALNMTLLALNSSEYINGVAQKHMEISQTMFPNYPIHSITNGVHAPTWVSDSFAVLFDKYIHHWREDPYSLRYASNISLGEIWTAHFESKKKIIDYTNIHSNAGMDYDFLTIGWARRFTAYKRPGFLFKDIERLRSIAETQGPIQIIFAGKAHPKDEQGKKLMTRIIKMINKVDGKIKMAYLTNYDMYLGKLMTSGVDLWLNTPKPPYEASGTSGMKCALNGIPHLSVLDGWWVEGCIEGETGWSFSKSVELYDLLEKKILPIYYKKPNVWRGMMKKAIMINGSFFNTTRMLHEYTNRAYAGKMV